jgi:hypothetical protein
VGCQVSQSADQAWSAIAEQNQPHLPLYSLISDGFVLIDVFFPLWKRNIASARALLSEACKKTWVYKQACVCELEINPVGSMPSDNNCFYVAAFWCEQNYYRKVLCQTHMEI